MRIPRSSTVLKWTFCFLTAVCVAAVTIVMARVISVAYTARQLLIAEASQKHVFWKSFLIYAGFNVTCAALGALCILLGSPQASGSGVTELVSFLNGIAVPKYLTFRTFVFKVLGSVVTVASSLPTGYQGVLLHIGGMIAYQLSEHFPRFELTVGAKRFANDPTAVSQCMVTVDTTSELGIYTSEARIPILAWRRGMGSRIASVATLHNLATRARRSPPKEKPGRVHFLASTTQADLVACGAAAGMAAAFKAPIGGMLYVMELSTRWRLELTWRTFFSTSVTALGLTVLMDGCKENAYCSFIVPRGPGSSYKSYSMYKYTAPFDQLHYIVFFGVVMGLIGALYVSINCWLCKLRCNWSHKKRLLFLEVVCLSLVHSIAFLLMTTQGKCRSCKGSLATVCLSGDVRKNQLERLFCNSDEYNDLASLVVSSAGSSIRNFWTSKYNSYDGWSLSIFIPVYFFIFVWTNGVCMPTGSFTPTILLGSACGRMFSHVLHVTGAVKEPDASLYAVLGAAGFFTGQTRMTIGLCVILLEMTQVESILPFLMLVVIVAKGTADRWNDSLIIRRVHLKRIPFLARMPHMHFRRIQVTAIDVAVIHLNPSLPVSAPLSLIKDTLEKNPGVSIFVVLGRDTNNVSSMTHRPSRTPSSVHLSQSSSDTNHLQPSVHGRIFLGVISRTTLESLLPSLGHSLSRTPPFQPHKSPRSTSDSCLTPPGWFGEQHTDSSSAVSDTLSAPLLSYTTSEDTLFPAASLSQELANAGCVGGTLLGASQGGIHEGVSVSLARRDWDAFVSEDDDEECEDLKLLMQAPPVTISPSMALSAVFYLMNTMALELIPVLSPGSVYHGLVTRASIIRYQKKHQFSWYDTSEST